MESISIASRVIIGGITVPASRWEVRRGTYGSVGTFEVVTDAEALASVGLNLVSALENSSPQPPTNSPSLPIEIWAGPTGAANPTRIFAGDIDEDGWAFDEDMVTITGRDFSGRMKDSQVVLSSPEYTNKTPSQLATLLATQNGLTPVVTTSADEQMIGFYFETDMIKTALPRQRWELLVFLARQINGYEVYTTPNMELVFGPVQATSPRVYTWLAAPNTPGIVPIRHLKVSHNPRRNLNFQVIVLSYHPKTRELVSSVGIVLGTPLTTTSMKTIQAGMWKGSDAAHVRSLLGTKMDGRPVYIYYIQGLTAAQTEEKAEAIAADIWKRAYIADGEIDGDPTLLPQTPIRLAAGPNADLQGFDQRNFSITSLTHSYEVPQNGAQGQGFLTRFTASYVPPPPYEVGAIALPPVT